MNQPTVTATPYDPLLTYQFRLLLLDAPDDVTPEQMASSRGTLGRRQRWCEQPGHRRGVVGLRRRRTARVRADHDRRGDRDVGGRQLAAQVRQPAPRPVGADPARAGDLARHDVAGAGRRQACTSCAPGTLGQPVKRNVLLDVYDPGVSNSGETRPRLRYVIFNAWVSKYQALPRLDAMADEVALLSIELTHHGWRKDAPPTVDQPE